MSSDLYVPRLWQPRRSMIVNPYAHGGGGGGGGGGSEPDSITGLHTWHKADAITGLSDGDPVSQWDDESGNGWHLTQASSTVKPAYKTGILNGLPVVRFGSDDFLDWAASVFSGLTAAEMFIVLAVVSDPSSTPTFNGAWNLGSTSSSTHYPFSDGGIYDDAFTTSRKTTGNPSQDLTAFHLYNALSQSGEWTSRINGTQHYTTASNTFGAESSAPRIGRAQHADYYLVGDVAEVIIYDNVLSSGDRDTVESYIADKYGLTIS